MVEDIAVEKHKLILFNIIYCIIIFLLTIVPTWFLQFSTISIIETDIFFACGIIIALFIFNKYKYSVSIFGLTGWFLIILFGLLQLALSMYIQPMWWTFSILILKVGYIEANHQLGTKLPANIFVAMSVSICYAGVIGFIREIFYRILVRKKVIRT